ncbi:MAG: hypothetical protein HOV81_24525, partial [Kofleriaceae bacterium]|nr:hypothetical protein [Kofleriaceae bacterium]
MRCLLLALTLSSLVACGKDPGDDGGGGGGGGGVDAGFTGESFRLTWGPVNVPPSKEDTQCIWLRLNNETEIKVHSLHNVLSGGSHHLIVYKDDMDTTEQTTPTPCEPFTGALNSSGMVAPIAITQKADDKIYLPDRVAYTFAPHQMVKLEMHYLNATDSTESVKGDVDFFVAKASDIDHEAAILFTGSPDIDIKAGKTASLH